MLLFFHKRQGEGGPEHLCSRFTRLDQLAYISVVTEQDDDLSPFQQLDLICSVGRTTICRNNWRIEPGERIYTMWFDFGRVSGIDAFPVLTLRAQVNLDGGEVLAKEARWVRNQTYSDLGQLGGGVYSGGFGGVR